MFVFELLPGISDHCSCCWDLGFPVCLVAFGVLVSDDFSCCLFFKCPYVKGKPRNLVVSLLGFRFPCQATKFLFGISLRFPCAAFVGFSFLCVFRLEFCTGAHFSCHGCSCLRSSSLSNSPLRFLMSLSFMVLLFAFWTSTFWSFCHVPLSQLGFSLCAR